MNDFSDDIAMLKDLRKELEALRRDLDALRRHAAPNFKMLGDLGFNLTDIDARRIAFGDDTIREYAIRQIDERSDALERRMTAFEARWIAPGPLN